jgi:uncharacterized small protein (DUF1192 family)
MRGRVREALCPELQVLREGNRLLRAEVEKAEADAKEWQAIAYAPMKRASARSQEETMSEPIKLPPIPEHVQILFRDDLRTYARLAVEQATAELRAEVERLRAELARLTTPKNCWCESCDMETSFLGLRSRMSLCPECGDKRCPRSVHHDHQCQKPIPEPKETK